MNREQAKQLLPIIQAFADGETIQFKDEFGKWCDVAPWTEPMFRGETEYRIKLKPLEGWGTILVGAEDVATRCVSMSGERSKEAAEKSASGSSLRRVIHWKEIEE